MAKRVGRCVVALLVVLLLPLLLASSGAAQTSATSSLLVKLVAGLTADQETNVIARNGGVAISSIPALHLYVVAVPASDVDVVAARYQADPQVRHVEANKTRVSESIPSDPLYGNQWYLPRTGWDQVFGSVTPAGTAKVALLDTGVDATHPELADKVVPGTSLLDGSDGWTDPSGHGTWLAGIIAARTDMAPMEGIAAVAYGGVHIMPVTVLNSNGEGMDSDVIAGVIWAADHGADVILMAFSAPDFSQNLQDAIDFAWSKGVVVVAAVGNNAVGTPTFPAGDRGVMGVAATDQNDTLAWFSNSGQAVFIAAPGVEIQTIDINGDYIVVSGTSTSAAYVAGLAAFMKAVDPTLTNGVIVGRIARNADPAGTQEETGNGRINIPRALADTSTEFIEPAGAAPVGDGGPFVGPYVAANVRLLLTSGLSISPPSAADKTINKNQSFTAQVTISNQNNAGDTARTWSNISATLTVPAGWAKTADLSGATLGNATIGGTSACGAGVTTTSCTFSWTVTAPNATSQNNNITVNISGTPSGGPCSGGGDKCADTAFFNSVTVVNPAALSITSLTAQQQGVPGDVIVKAGQNVALALTAANTTSAPGAAATSVIGSSAAVTPSGTASATCGAASPATATIAAGGNQVYSYTCGTITGDGTLSFAASVSGADENTAAALGAGPGTSNLITVDSTAPTSGLTPASGTVNAPFSFSWSIADPTVGGVSSGVAAATCAVTIDGSPASTACSGSLSLGAGAHTVVVAAQDLAGNTLSDSRNYTVIADNTPPVVVLTFSAPVTGQNGYYNAGDTVPVIGSVTADDSTTGNSNITAISCPGAVVGSISGINTPSASAPVTVSGEGTHSITCTASDSAGNTGAGPGSANTKTVNIDTVAPDTSITANPTNPTNSTSATFSFSGTDPAPSSGGPTFECQLDGGGFTTCTSPKTYNSLTDGSHTFQVRAVDTAGNKDATPASFTWRVDTAPPTVTVTFPTPNGQAGWFVTSPVVGSITATDPSNVASINCSGATLGTVSGISTGSATASLTVTTDGMHSISCTATDGLGNNGAAPGSSNTATVNLDSVPPDTTLLTHPTNPTNSTSATFTFSGTDPAPSSGGPTFECKLDGGSFVACVSGVNYTGLTDGSHTFQVRAKDTAGNVDTTPASFTWLVDTVPPVISVTGFNDNDVFYTGGVLPTAGCSSPTDPTPSSGIAGTSGPTKTMDTRNVNGVGQVTYQCTATDGAGNVGSDLRTFYVRYGGASGILQPINPDNSSGFKRGQSVPVKFRLAGDEYAGFNTAGWKTQRVQVACVGGSDSLIEDVGSVTPSTVFRYDASADQYIYNADFRDVIPGTCWRVRVTLDDSPATVMDSAYFKIVK
jgi:subtilisin family serine protease